MSEEKNKENRYLDMVFRLLYLIIALMMFAGVFIYFSVAGVPDLLRPNEIVSNDSLSQPAGVNVRSISDVWQAPDTSTISNESNADEINYGRKLIIYTSYYLGPNGIVAHLSNGMNCQNCHLEAGTKPFGNNYSAVASTYPKFRDRSGKTESIFKRINDCFERSLNGKGLDTTSREMIGIKAYINWLGKNVKKGVKPKGAGIAELAYLNRAADPAKGKVVYENKCISCHGSQGEGKPGGEMSTFQYPPLWGRSSYNTGAGLFRLSRFAGYVKANMPFGISYDSPQLTDEEAWDVAAYVNSQTRSEMNLTKDWPKIASKPVDHPFGPYADKYSEEQHKFGPFEPIAALKKKNTKK